MIRECGRSKGDAWAHVGYFLLAMEGCRLVLVASDALIRLLLLATCEVIPQVLAREVPLRRIVLCLLPRELRVTMDENVLLILNSIGFSETLLYLCLIARNIAEDRSLDIRSRLIDSLVSRTISIPADCFLQLALVRIDVHAVPLVQHERLSVLNVRCIWNKQAFLLASH